MLPSTNTAASAAAAAAAGVGTATTTTSSSSSSSTFGSNSGNMSGGYAGKDNNGMYSLNRRGSHGSIHIDYYGGNGGNGRNSMGGFSNGGSGTSLFKYLRRVVYYPQMDLQYTFTQMVYLLHSPSKVYKLTSWRNQTKNQWARDDPAFVVILCMFIAVASVAYECSLGEGTFSRIVGVIGMQIGIFLGFGIAISTFGWWISNGYFRTRHSHSVEQEVEWMYAFDIHCNGYFPMFLALYVVQYLFLPLLLSETFVATIVANTLYALAFSYYHYVSFLGYMYLPFLNKELVTSMLYPIAGLAVLYVLFVVLNINASRFALSFFF